MSTVSEAEGHVEKTNFMLGGHQGFHKAMIVLFMHVPGRTLRNAHRFRTCFRLRCVEPPVSG